MSNQNAEHLQALMRYTAWANQVLYHALAGLDEELLARPRPGRLEGMLGVLGHIYVVGMIWKGHLTRQGHGFKTRSLEATPSLSILRQWQAELDDWYLGFACSLPPDRCRTPIDFLFVDGGAGRMTAEQMLLHVSNHGTYHRGYIADMLYEAGTRPPTMDFPVFIRDGATG
ncbi:MAG TPA: DinB family protein [Ramlibacter sp.]|nr:DinB family protein [Ramlibacter sp.]